METDIYIYIYTHFSLMLGGKIVRVIGTTRMIQIQSLLGNLLIIFNPIKDLSFAGMQAIQSIGERLRRKPK